MQTRPLPLLTRPGPGLTPRATALFHDHEALSSENAKDPSGSCAGSGTPASTPGKIHSPAQDLPPSGNVVGGRWAQPGSTEQVADAGDDLAAVQLDAGHELVVR